MNIKFGHHIQPRSSLTLGRFRYTVLLAVISVLVALQAMTQTSLAQSVSVSASSSVLGVTDSADITLNATDIPSAVHGFEVTFNYDETVLQFDSADAAAWVSSTGRTVTCSAPVVADGTVTMACATADDNCTGIVGPDGSGALATLSFTALADGVSPVTLAGVTLQSDGTMGEIGGIIVDDTAAVSITVGDSLPTAITLDKFVPTSQSRWFVTALFSLIALSLYALITRRKSVFIVLFTVTVLSVSLMTGITDRSIQAQTSGDVAAVAALYGCSTGDDCYNSMYDVDSNGMIDLSDMMTAANAVCAVTDVILAQNPGMHPEGIEWDAVNERFLVGSLTMGNVFAVADDGTVTPFITSDSLMGGSVGIHIDKATNRLLVAHSNPNVLAGDPAVIGFAQLGIYDMATGDELHFVDLTALGASSGRFFANDVTADANGNAYVTNSESTEIYKVAMDGTAEIFVNDVNANGIEFHPDGYLLAAARNAPSLIKLSLDDPSIITTVALSEPAAMDGIILDANGDLIAVAKTQFQPDNSFEDEVIQLHSEDGWATAQLVARGTAIPESSPTTVTLRDGNPYVVHAHFAELAMGVLVEAFEIMRVPLVAGE